MARDETARDRGSERPLLDRRSYLRLAGAAVAAVAVAGASGDAATASHDTVEVSANAEEVVRVADGETFENVIFDLTADGARLELRTAGRDAAVRNVGVAARDPAVDRPEAGVGGPTLPSVLVVDGSDRPRSSAAYAFEASGTVRERSAPGGTASDRYVSDSAVAGTITDGAAVYGFSGDAIGLGLDGPASVRVE